MTRRVSTTEWAPNLERFLAAEGWTQRELAEKAGLSENQITILLTKDSNPRMGSLRAVLEAFNAARQARGAPEIQLWQVFLPADLATHPNKGVELGTPLTPTSEPIHAPAEPRPAGTGGPAADESPEFRDQAVRRKILATIRELASALEPPGDPEGRRIGREAVAESEAADPGSASSGPPHLSGGGRRRRA